MFNKRYFFSVPLLAALLLLANQWSVSSNTSDVSGKIAACITSIDKGVHGDQRTYNDAGKRHAKPIHSVREKACDDDLEINIPPGFTFVALPFFPSVITLFSSYQSPVSNFVYAAHMLRGPPTHAII